MRGLRPLLTGLGLLGLWQGLVWLTAVPPYILPGPAAVVQALWTRAPLLLDHAAVTLAEIVLGILIGTGIGILSAITLAASRHARRWLLPLLIVSQALPVFALAPLLVLWLGYGMASKVAMAVLIIYFPVTAAFYDGLKRAEPGWLDLAQVMGASKAAALWQIRVPAALPALASGPARRRLDRADRRRRRRVGRRVQGARLPDAARQRPDAGRFDVRGTRELVRPGARPLVRPRCPASPPDALAVRDDRLTRTPHNQA